MHKRSWKYNTGLFKMIFGFSTTCHTKYTWDSSIRIFLFNRTTLSVFVTYLTGALYVHPLWFYKYQRCQRWWFQWRFWFVPSVPGEMHNYRTPHIIKENFEHFLIHRCSYLLLYQELLNNPVYTHVCIYIYIYTHTHTHTHISGQQIMILYIYSEFCISTQSGTTSKMIDR